MVDQQRVDNLALMFPRIPRDVIRNAVVTCASMNTAVNVLLQYGEIDHDSNPNASGASTSSDNNSNIKTQDSPAQTVGSLPFVLQNLRRNMKSRGMREKLKVDQEDEVMDVYSYYKSSYFDPLISIYVYLKGQPAIDTGSVLRQLFSNVFYALANKEGIKNIFVGSEGRRLPVFSNELVVNGFFETLGKMIAHSLVQGGPGLPENAINCTEITTNQKYPWHKGSENYCNRPCILLTVRMNMPKESFRCLTPSSEVAVQVILMTSSGL